MRFGWAGSGDTTPGEIPGHGGTGRRGTRPGNRGSPGGFPSTRTACVVVPAGDPDPVAGLTGLDGSTGLRGPHDHPGQRRRLRTRRPTYRQPHPSILLPPGEGLDCALDLYLTDLTTGRTTPEGPTRRPTRLCESAVESRGTSSGRWAEARQASGPSRPTRTCAASQ
jgi:hypothetical protein